ncbi:hypothetical protein BDV27DRAFT_52911 [Aspergillus caelatus]|uniref:Uncharacterized protein n=1 Tax=Aspergillus caelatus TaxID=61420 RepID=A0A5N6ZQR4_9EURO|nr:uncharacterized protein BDV27DRAFT_52911 [Aspergillus caelatus]KAE8359553.1 hypothetical protein BDV27DRAFT_52911 [Aspergillus caelatus]
MDRLGLILFIICLLSFHWFLFSFSPFIFPLLPLNYSILTTHVSFYLYHSICIALIYRTRALHMSPSTISFLYVYTNSQWDTIKYIILGYTCHS